MQAALRQFSYLAGILIIQLLPNNIVMKNLLIIFIAGALLVSCKKDNGSGITNGPDRTTLLTQKAWYTTSVLTRPVDSDPWAINLFSDEPCNKDNIITFTTAGVYNQDEGATKCNSSNPQTVEHGTFNFTTNETHLWVSIDAGFSLIEDWTINQLNDSTLVYEYYFPGTGPFYKVTMKH
jgi:hypothetical protein